MRIVLMVAVSLIIASMPNHSVRSFTLVSDYLDPCTESDECTDHRFVCLPDEKGTRRCVCDGFHKWAGEQQGCVQIYNFHRILNETVITNHEAEKLKSREKRIFGRHLAAVYFFIGVFIMTVLIVIGYCQHIRIKDRRVKRTILQPGMKRNPEYLPSRTEV